MALNYLLKVRSTVIAQRRTHDWRLFCRLLLVSLMALFLRGGVLSLLSQGFGWSAQLAILPAVIAGLAVTAPGYAAALSQTDGSETWRRLALGLIAYAFMLRLVYVGTVELLPEEAYYWNYSRHLDIAYLDHPPMVAWLIKLGTAVFGQTQFGVRASALVCGVITSVYIYRLTRNLFGEASALAALALAQILPFFFMSSLLMTPDAPLTAAWAAALFYIERALIAGRAGAWWRLGLALGIGAVSKYTVGLLVPVTLAFMLWDSKSHRWWRRWEPYAAAVVALAIFSPVILWNAQHEWASFAFQTSRRLAEAPRFSLHKLIAASLILITPTGVLAIAAALTSSKPAGADDENAPRRRLFLRIALLFPLSVFTIFSLRHEVKLDWSGGPWTGALPLMAAGMVAGGAKLSGLQARIRAAWMPTLVTMLLIYAAGLHYVALGLPGVGYNKHNELIPVGWREFSRQVLDNAATVRGAGGKEPLIVGMDRYAIASELAFYGAEQRDAPVATSSMHLFGGMGLMYELWMPAKLQEGRTLLLIAWDPKELTGKLVESHAERWGPVEEAVLTHDGRVVRRYYHRLAYRYRAQSSIGD